MNKIKIACILLFIPIGILFIIMLSIGIVLVLTGMLFKFIGYNMWLVPEKGWQEWREIKGYIKLFKN